MANKEQLNILKEGLGSWKRWRRKNPDVEIDLSQANLRELDLRMPDLRGVNLDGAYLGRANLIAASLTNTSLREAALDGAILNGANLSGADLRGASLRMANLNRTTFRGANLDGADLREAKLIKTDLSEAKFTGVQLYGTSRDDWVIDGIYCDFVYWDENLFFSRRKERKKQWEQEHRFPQNRNFHPGEFEELYKQLPTFEYVFKHGIQILDMAIIDHIVNEFNNLYPEWELKIDSFQALSQPRAVFSLREKHLVTEVFQQLKTKYEAMLNSLKGERDAIERAHYAFMREAIHRPHNVISAEKVVMGDENHKTARRDYLEHVEGSDVTTGESFEGK